MSDSIRFTFKDITLTAVQRMNCTGAKTEVRIFVTVYHSGAKERYCCLTEGSWQCEWRKTVKIEIFEIISKMSVWVTWNKTIWFRKTID